MFRNLNQVEKTFSLRPRFSPNFSQFLRLVTRPVPIIFPEFTQNLPRIYLEFSRIPPEFTQYLPKIQPRIHQEFTQNLIRGYFFTQNGHLMIYSGERKAK